MNLNRKDSTMVAIVLHYCSWHLSTCGNCNVRPRQ